MKRRNVLLTLVAAAALAALAAFGLSPVCEPLDREQISSMKPPLAERADRDIYVRVFQKHDGQWFECKTRLSRLFSF